jgi:putative ABC transport system permease protein
MMRWIAEAWSRLRSIPRRGALEKGLDEEIRFHLEQQAEKLRGSGLPAEEARRLALVRFGGVERFKESTRDEIRPALLEDSMRDVRYGIRMLGRAPAFTAAALMTLALGVGATSAIFSIVRAVALRPLPYAEPDRLVAVWETGRGTMGRNVIAAANFVAWRERTRTLDHLAMVAPVQLPVIVSGQPIEIRGFAFSADAFRALGVQPALGRAYTPDEDFGRNAGVVVLGHEFWQRHFGGRADAVGQTLATDGQPRTILGVMPSDFTVVGEKTDFLIPYAETIEQLRVISGRGNSYGLARLRDGVSFDQALSEMRGIHADLTREFPQRNARRALLLIPLQEQMVGELRPAMFALVAAVALVLLVACVNVANLLLARSASREREVSMRTALGARRGRLVRQMLIESLVLAAAGGIAGLGVAALCHRGLLALVSDRIPVPRLDQVRLDLPVVAFTLATALVTGLVFGVVPAFVSTKHAGEALREGGRHGGGRRLHRVLRGLVVAEVALSLVLLAGAGLLLRSFVKLQNVDPGFRAGGVVAARVQLPRGRYDAVRSTALWREALARVAALPGVSDAAGATCAPMPGSCIGTSFWRADRPAPATGQAASGHIRPVTPRFFRTLGIPQRSGRDFADSDTAESTPVAIVSEEVVRQHFGDDDPIGRRIRVNIEHASGRGDVEWTVVGVVGNIKSSLDGPARQTIYLPMPQRPDGRMNIFVRAVSDDVAVGGSVTQVMHALEPEAPVELRALDDLVGGTIARSRVVSMLAGVFALIALVLATVGVYGVMAYTVRERTREIGVRMALGATATSVFRLVIGQALRLVIAGVAVGLLAAAAATRLLQKLLYDIEPFDPLTFGTTALLLLAVAAIAAYVPARRGMRMAPVDALRVH